MRGMDLNAVETGFLRSFCSGSKVSYDLVDLIDCHLPGQIHAERILDSGRCHRLHIAVDSMLGLTSRMIHLAEDFGIIFVNRLGEFFITLHLGVIIEAGNKLIALGVLIDRIVLCDQKAPAAPGFFLHILDVAFGDHSVFRAKIHDHCRHDQPIGNLAVTDFAGREQFFKHPFFLLCG